MAKASPALKDVHLSGIMFLTRVFGRTLLAAAKTETSAAGAAAAYTVRTGHNPLEELFEADRNPEEEKHVIYDSSIQTIHSVLKALIQSISKRKSPGPVSVSGTPPSAFTDISYGSKSIKPSNCSREKKITNDTVRKLKEKSLLSPNLTTVTGGEREAESDERRREAGRQPQRRERPPAPGSRRPTAVGFNSRERQSGREREREPFAILISIEIERQR
ncbi:Ribosomal protein L47, mitochondrial [Cynara cardunculus var. scolymus]|uniref:Ribosomal protein L47, mitochondrial n=1 Tax=Cynara cardunculus var. scolymus TaxID=59895 RepID=A0A103YC09_CYNCS|nr:Ribosomal protein L47, mitochondrial [Cynara cardunculus var. scolymus]